MGARHRNSGARSNMESENETSRRIVFLADRALARESANFDADKFDRASGAAEYLAGVATLVRSTTPRREAARPANTTPSMECYHDPD